MTSYEKWRAKQNSDDPAIKMLDMAIIALEEILADNPGEFPLSINEALNQIDKIADEK